MIRIIGIKIIAALVFALLMLLVVGLRVVFAQVVINEVFANTSGPSSEPDEFIELFNTGSESATITGWKLSDTKGSTKTYILPESSLEAGAYANFRRSVTDIILNNDGDGVELKDSDDKLVDSINYDEAIEGKSWSRIPNGSGSFVNNTEISELASNIVPPTPVPTPTPSPTRTPTNTPLSTPTRTPTSIPAAAPTRTPTPTSGKTTLPTHLVTRSGTPEVSPAALSSVQESAVALKSEPPGNVLGVKIASETPFPIKKEKILSYAAIGFGLVLIIVAALLAYRTSKSGKIQNDI